MVQQSAEEDHLLSITSQFRRIGQPRQMSLVDKAELYLFFSIDICNSTELKEQEKNWLNANRLLYEETFDAMHLWKFIGDEAVYAEPLERINELPILIKQAHTYLKQLQNELCSYFGSAFRIKGAIWMAEMGEQAAGHHIKSLNMINEFLGVEIDEGFRLSKNISGSKIVLDPKIVYALLMVHAISKNEYKGDWFDADDPIYVTARNMRPLVYKHLLDVLSCVSFMGYTRLKGIWNNRLYPIYWYGQENVDFEYDEQLNGTLITPRKVDEYTISVLERIFTTVGVKNKLIKIFNSLANKKYKNIYTIESPAMLYYSVACVNPNTGRVLIARRSAERIHLKGVWEFIPFKHTSMGIVASIEKKFLDQFGVRISIVTDEEKEQNVFPLHFCTMYRYGRAHNNLLCVAYFDEGQSDDAILTIIKKKADKAMHSDFAFIDSKLSEGYRSLSSKEIEMDSVMALQRSSNFYEEKVATMYFRNTVQAVEAFVKRKNKGGKWYDNEGSEG